MCKWICLRRCTLSVGIYQCWNLIILSVHLFHCHKILLCFRSQSIHLWLIYICLTLLSINGRLHIILIFLCILMVPFLPVLRHSKGLHFIIHRSLLHQCNTSLIFGHRMGSNVNWIIPDYQSLLPLNFYH